MTNPQIRPSCSTTYVSTAPVSRSSETGLAALNVESVQAGIGHDAAVGRRPGIDVNAGQGRGVVGKDTEGGPVVAAWRGELYHCTAISGCALDSSTVRLSGAVGVDFGGGPDHEGRETGRKGSEGGVGRACSGARWGEGDRVMGERVELGLDGQRGYNQRTDQGWRDRCSGRRTRGSRTWAAGRCRRSGFRNRAWIETEPKCGRWRLPCRRESQERTQGGRQWA